MMPRVSTEGGLGQESTRTRILNSAWVCLQKSTVNAASSPPCDAADTSPVFGSINNAFAYGITEGWSWQIPLLAVGALVAIAALLAPTRRLTRARPAPA